MLKKVKVSLRPIVSKINFSPETGKLVLTTGDGGSGYDPWFYNQHIKYAGNVGQDLVESIFSFVHYKPIPVTQLN